MWCRFGTVNKLIFDWFCGVCFSFFLFSFPFSMNKLPITRIILLPIPHRQKQSMVAVIIVFINRCHSIHEVLPKSKYYLFPIYIFFALLRSMVVIFHFIHFQFFFLFRCFTLCFVFVIRFLGFFLVQCTLLILYVNVFLFLVYRTMIQVSRIYERH